MSGNLFRGVRAPVDPAAIAAPPRAECRVDLAALRANIRTLRSGLTSPTQLWSVIKADAYGHGVERVAQAAIAENVHRLCVATLSEARHLRSLGIRVPILILGPLDTPSLRRARDLDVAVTVTGERMLKALAHVGNDGAGRSLKVHLKVDTGMGRWGVPIDRVAQAIQTIVGPGGANGQSVDGLALEGIMTHFATADERDDTTFLHTQLDRFTDVVKSVRDAVPGVIAHAANSAATIHEPSSHFDAVRCGVALFGLSPTQTDAASEGLAPVMSLSSYVAEVRERDAGESVGYCRSFIADHKVRVAEVPVGYADGIPRAVANRAQVMIGDKRCDVIGNVSMDHITVLVDESVVPGDGVLIFGGSGPNEATTEQFAAAAGTINYEITCSIAGEPRLRRTYVGG